VGPRTSLDEIAGLYHQGSEAFFGDWQDFTETSTPTIINLRPRVTLIARGLRGRPRSAFDFLQENGLPVTVIPVAIYEEDQGRRFVEHRGRP